MGLMGDATSSESGWPGTCPRCGYDVSGAVGEGCPECGLGAGDIERLGWVSSAGRRLGGLWVCVGATCALVGVELVWYGLINDYRRLLVPVVGMAVAPLLCAGVASLSVWALRSSDRRAGWAVYWRAAMWLVVPVMGALAIDGIQPLWATMTAPLGGLAFLTHFSFLARSLRPTYAVWLVALAGGLSSLAGVAVMVMSYFSMLPRV
jgi:hypothetical protein